MLVIYSYCSYSNGRPSEFTLKMAKLSLLSLRNMTSYRVKLYVDKESLSYFANFGYDEIEVSDFNISGIDKRFWNASKLWVYAQQSEPFLHVDFDTCFLDSFTIPTNGDIITEKLRTVDISNGYDFYSLSNIKQTNTIICSGLIGGISYGHIFKDHYEWAYSRMLEFNKVITYEMLNSIEEYSLTQRIEQENMSVACLQKDTFLHFWCNRNCGLTKEQAYHEVVDALLEFNTDLYSSKQQLS